MTTTMGRVDVRPLTSVRAVAAKGITGRAVHKADAVRESASDDTGWVSSSLSPVI